MPLYEYEPAGPASCPECVDGFETFQKMADEPLTACPACGSAVLRRLSMPAVHGAKASGQQISNKNLAEKGFTKYVKAGDGHYEKAAGKGPDVIKR